VSALVYGAGSVNLKLLDSSNTEIASASQHKSTKDSHTVTFSIPVKNPKKWTAETPNLYNLVVSIDDKQYTAHRVGFRVVELKDGLIKVNGQRVVFKGANRHEHCQSGRTVPYEFMKKDLILMKTHNINAIRTCHQPSDVRLYDLADEIGLWVMDEADLECHGFETIADQALPPEQQALPFFERQQLTREHAAKWTSDNPAWEEAYLDRAKQMVFRDRLHPSVVMWSLGNEAFYGRNHVAMRNWIKEYDSTRLIHYEPDLQAEHMDMYSRMYLSVHDLKSFGKDDTKVKPLVLCEFIHAMGTGPGNIKEYIDAFYQYPNLQGGFVWEWANHGLEKLTKDGKPYFGYGGDFDDVPNDGNFVMDGVLNSDHSPRSALVEYKKALEPVQVISWTRESVKLISRLDFDTLDHLDCTWTVTDESGTRPGGKVQNVPSAVQPGATFELAIPSELTGLTKETFFNLSFTLKEKTTWADAGHEVAFLQVPISPASPAVNPSAAAKSTLKAHATTTTLSVEGKEFQFKFDLIRGRLCSWKKAGREIIANALEPTFYRAPTDNDAPSDGKDWKNKFLHLARVHTRSAKWHEIDGSVSVELVQKFAPPVLSWSLDLQTRYVFSPSGTVKIHIDGTPAGQNLPAVLPRIGMEVGLQADFQNVKWYGRGPRESYRDMKLGQRVDLHAVSEVDDLWEAPEFPQECSNRTDTRWLELSSKDASFTAQFLASESGDERHLFDFMASHYDVKDIDEAKHPYELDEKKKDHVVLRLDAYHHGLGTGSCGPKTLEEYALKTAPFEFTLLLH
jgi:beta-galactosidase